MNGLGLNAAEKSDGPCLPASRGKEENLNSAVHIITFPSDCEDNKARSTLCSVRLKSSTQKASVVASAIACCLLLTTLEWGSGVSSEQKAGGQGVGLCASPPCANVSSRIVASMNLSVDPCQDFYEYACGKWAANNPRPAELPNWVPIIQLRREKENLIKEIIEQPAESLLSEAERSAQRYYQSCLDVNGTRKSLGMKPMLELLNVIGGWPAIDPAVDVRSWDFQKATQTAHLMGVYGFFSWQVMEDLKNSSNHVFTIDDDGLSLNPQSYRKTNKLENLLTRMTKIAQILNSSADVNSVKLQMQEVIDLEKRIASITVLRDMRDIQKLYHRLTIAELNSMAPFINWTSYLQSAFSHANITITISSSYYVVVSSPDYLEDLSSIVEELLATDKGRTTLHNYVAWQVISRYIGGTHAGLGGAALSWRSCIDYTEVAMSFAISAMFVRHKFHEESKPLAEAMIANVKQALKDNFERLDWLDDETRRAAREKADAITHMIGYPKFIANSTELDEFYKDLRIESNEYLMNSLRVNQFAGHQSLKRLGEPVYKTWWDLPPSTVNAYYKPPTNQIVFPAGISQPPLFDATYPNALNYGAMGMIIGHELTHAFDTLGRQFNGKGELTQWWNDDAIERFQRQTKCFVDQYSSFSWNGASLNGILTLGENIADNGGLKAAYHAFTKLPKVVDDDEFYLPGLNVTQNQLFFLSFAQAWCSSATNEGLRWQISNDPHSPARYRVMGPLSNMPEFSSVFQCPAGSPMNPKNKCELW